MGTHAENVYQAWEEGILSYKLKKNQRVIFNQVMRMLKNPKERKYVLHCSRRFGKTFILVLLALTVCIRKKNANVRYAAPTAKAVRKMIKPIVRKILADCPPEFKPQWNTYDECYKFPNGSELHISGVNNGHEDDLRGTESDLNIVDEAGFVNQLRYVVDSVLTPQLITTDGITLISSSSPRTPAHEFADHYIPWARTRGLYASFTIYDSDYAPEKIAEFAEEAGGVESTTFRREYLNEIIVDKNYQIIPEWKKEYELSADFDPVKGDEFYRYYFKYTTMDQGVIDWTAVGYGYYDFKRAELILLDEQQWDGISVTTNVMRPQIQAKEQEYNFNGPAVVDGQMQKDLVKKRTCDNNDLKTINDFANVTGADGKLDPKIKPLHFTPVHKLASLHQMVNETRNFVAQGRLRIHPRCTYALGNMQFGVWNEKKTEFARTPTYKHFDHLAMIIYKIRSAIPDMNTNPIPITHGHDLKNYGVAPEVAKDKKPPLIGQWGQGAKKKR